MLAVPFGPFPFADPFPLRQVIHHTYSFASGPSSSGSNGLLTGVPVIFNMNDLFAPGGTIAHQPYGRDQMAALYGRYKVRRFTVELECLGGGTQSILIMAATSPSAGFNYSGCTTTDAMEQPGVQAILCPTTTPRKIVKSFDIAQVLGVDKREFEADVSQYAAAAGSSPAVLAKFQIVVGAIVSTTQTASIVGRVSYEAEWFDRITQAAS